ncbi:hypothetical protein OJ998_15845 [Solirubrobacter taibaiensis]|nr:hypothetical protein [Solirubrobacter taibaiensis]
MWLWACHGPNGQALTAAQITKETNADKLGEGCTAPDAPGARAGYTLKPAAGTTSSLVLTVPSGMSAKAVQVNRTLRGFAGSTGASYRVAADNQTLETDAAPGTGVLPVTTPASSVTLDVSCSSTCASNPEVDVVSVAVLVSDTTAPSGGVSWNTPVDRTMVVTPTFTDSGAGLDRAELNYGGRVSPPVYFNNTDNCRELSPADGTNDRPIDVTACRNGEVTGQNLPLKALTAPIVAWEDKEELDELGRKTGRWIEDTLRRLPEGLFPWTVTVYDVAGNSAQLSNTVEVWHPPAPVATRTLNISTASVTEQPGSNNNNPPAGGGVQGSQASQCRSPRLSVVLNSKPVRVSKNVPVLKYKKAYKFTGRLTCVINGKRQSAPKRTKVSILNKVGKKTVRKPNTAIRAKGAVNLKLAFVSDRTVIFRYTNAAGQKSEVKIKVRVTKQKK